MFVQWCFFDNSVDTTNMYVCNLRDVVPTVILLLVFPNNIIVLENITTLGLFTDNPFKK